MVSSRPSASILPGAPLFGAWWGTPASREIARQADSARRSGDLARAESLYKSGYEDAVLRRDQKAAVGYLNGIAACQLTQLRYQAALKTLLEAKERAKSIRDRESLGAIAVNLSALYLQVWDFDNALKEAEEGSAAAASLRRPYFQASLLIQLGRVHDIRGDGTAEAFYRQGIDVARSSGSKQTEALGLDLLGEERLGRQDLEEAEKAITAGMRLRERYSPNELDLSWWRMGELKLLRGELADAARYTDLALNAARNAPEYRLKNQRGRIRLASGDRPGALADLREAVESSFRWRAQVMAAGSSLTSANRLLERYVFSSFIEAAAGESLRTGDQRLAEEAFEAVELNRAASLRESLELAPAWHKKVSLVYWETLANLRKEDVRNRQKKVLSEESKRLRLELAEMEAKAGLGFSEKNPEIFHDRSSLIHFRQGLGRTEVVLSFYLGDRESYLWAVTREAVRLYKIAAKNEIEAKAKAFANAVEAGRAEAEGLGEALYGELFGQLRRQTAEKSSWLLSLEGTLFEVPFAALVTEQKDGKVNFLVSKHSVQTIPGALLLSTRPAMGTGWFLGVGDPIYNSADPRWVKKKESPFFFNLLATFQTGPASSDSEFGRLVGTAAEVRTSAGNWNQRAVLLEGADATRESFLGKLPGNPSVIHLATHITRCRTQSCIAFGLGPNGAAGFLTTADVASLRVPGAFVAMTGCASGSGEVLSGAGVSGLTRAWQMAGANTILATSWPVKDSTGEILASFYRHLRDAPPAEALRLAQAGMLQSGTWRASPEYWAAYQITGGAR
jgi:CHAT domain-containing protein